MIGQTPARPRVSLIMPMAGRGSRFAREGFSCPKPLIDLGGKPFFWWATQSITRSFDVVRLVYIVLEEHIADHAIDRRIRELYPDAHVVALANVTAGALESALQGLDHAVDDGPLIINDCDHCFDADALAATIGAFAQDLPAALLCHFHAVDALYSFAEYDHAGRLRRTAEKRAISTLAIAGAYWFRSAALLRQYADVYRRQCPYDETFVSGIHNTMVGAGEAIRGVLLKRHLPFGVVSEYRHAQEGIASYADWLAVAAP